MSDDFLRVVLKQIQHNALLVDSILQVLNSFCKGHLGFRLPSEVFLEAISILNLSLQLLESFAQLREQLYLGLIILRLFSAYFLLNVSYLRR